MLHARAATVNHDDGQPTVRHTESTTLRESLSSSLPLSVPLRPEIAPRGMAIADKCFRRAAVFTRATSVIGDMQYLRGSFALSGADT